MIHFLEIFYEGLLITAIFLTVNIGLFFVKDKKTVIKVSSLTNLIFIIIFLGIVILERVYEYPSLDLADSLDFRKLALEIIYEHSNKLFALLIYFSVNTVLLYSKFIIGQKS